MMCPGSLKERVFHLVKDNYEISCDELLTLSRDKLIVTLAREAQPVTLLGAREGNNLKALLLLH